MSGGKLFHYTQCGLDDVWLQNGFRTVETEYGDGFSVDRADELHQLIVKGIIESPRPLRGQEARFVRAMLKLSQADLARLLGVDRTTVIRWESAREKPLNMMADLAVRTTYSSRTGDGLIAKVIQELQDADEKKHGDRYRAVFVAKNSGWSRAA